MLGICTRRSCLHKLHPPFDAAGDWAGSSREKVWLWPDAPLYRPLAAPPPPPPVSRDNLQLSWPPLQAQQQPAALPRAAAAAALQGPKAPAAGPAGAASAAAGAGRGAPHFALPAEQRVELVHRQLQKQQELLEAAVHRASVAKLEVARLNKKVTQLQGELNASRGEAGRLREQLRQQEAAAAQA
jgi:hypothetical protein